MACSEHHRIVSTRYQPSIRGFQEIQESDMLVVPDPTTAFLDPFTTHQSRCPRSLLRHRLR
ncbi:MAG: glutamine synthetase, partial [Pseudolabrys sp.]